MKILAIESSCDDTSVALVEANQAGFAVLSEKTASQIEVHKKYGGVVPEIAGRMHAEKILPVIEEVINKNKPDIIAVTAGPGLITGLLVGVETAKTLAYLWNLPLVGINHIEGHIYSVELEKKNDFPALALVASGGHTELILIKKPGKYKQIGATRDDAAGECFDKVAKLLDFDYPGGPKISQQAKLGNIDMINFPRPMLNEDNFDFSFSGLKTSALYYLRDHPEIDKNDFCASFEQAIVDVLISKTLKAVKKYNPQTVILAGGVSANKKLRQTLEKKLNGIKFLTPPIKYAMDNAVMIALAGYYHAIKKDFTPWPDLKAEPNWKIYE